MQESGKGASCTLFRRHKICNLVWDISRSPMHGPRLYCRQLRTVVYMRPSVIIMSWLTATPLQFMLHGISNTTWPTVDHLMICLVALWKNIWRCCSYSTSPFYIRVQCKSSSHHKAYKIPEKPDNMVEFHLQSIHSLSQIHKFSSWCRWGERERKSDREDHNWCLPSYLFTVQIYQFNIAAMMEEQEDWHQIERRAHR